MLAAFVSVEVLNGQITGQGTINGYAWLFTGLCLASSVPQAEPDDGSVWARIKPGPRFPDLLR
jgi:hypothetical protein